MDEILLVNRTDSDFACTAALCFMETWLILLCCTCADENKEAVKAKEGATVTLQTRDTIHNINTQIVWTFGPENPNMRIATVKKREARSDYVERFRDRLQLDSLTGALTITQLRVTDSGVYMWQSISSNILSQNLHLSVYSSVTPPFITVNTSLVNMSCSSVILQCSAENTREMTLAWYRGRDRVKNISSPDLSFRLSLPLEIESHDGDNYSCVAENPVDEKATTLFGIVIVESVLDVSLYSLDIIFLESVIFIISSVNLE
uniref:Ig-like domain-containing protein n=1 Tax=Monopterus albus TaxID=43700 RepID=A0A3Q3J9H9_MONAL